MSSTLTEPTSPRGPVTRDAKHALGDRLRRIRRQQGLSLADVEERSGGEWKAVVVGAYERGDRSVSIGRLAGLARFYGVPLSELLPAATAAAGADAAERVVIDLAALEAQSAPAAAAIARYVDRIRRMRGDHNGRVLTVRGGDLENLALIAGADPERLMAELRARGVVRDQA
jgi:transcriptional regulator with XRE-family HTH domain